ncbi:retrovirus-related Pol polyprotein from transposon 17.6 [Trichonephila inaurata madagascariensis]|uniref:Retrovirus-related Pol polyprotein from transposon 17.6 n=1 Tax=Trichonephila inaurata madagascariensis TaxID=2747483 RepID=A0A8X6WWM8_9ARAC|nr:retrovirus-related Pol polyprotein from transposon 17.6 [Trichonephila inaurata madagascariensis]
MAYLGKGRKSDLSYITEQLGERVTDDLKIIDLRDLIVNSTNYDEEFILKQEDASSVLNADHDHFRPQCPKLKKYSSETINRLKSNSENASLDPYTTRGKVNGFEMPILKDTGASKDIICEKFITPNMFTGENVWVQHILDEHMTCLPLAEVEIDCEWGHIITKAAVVRKQLDQGRYILGNRTIELLESD